MVTVFQIILWLVLQFFLVTADNASIFWCKTSMEEVLPSVEIKEKNDTGIKLMLLLATNLEFEEEDTYKTEPPWGSEVMEQDEMKPEALEEEDVGQKGIEQDAMEREALQQDDVEKEEIEQDAMEPEAIEKEDVEQKGIEQDELEMEELNKEDVEQKGIDQDAMEPEVLEQDDLERKEKAKMGPEKIENEEVKSDKMEPNVIFQDKTETDQIESEADDTESEEPNRNIEKSLTEENNKDWLIVGGHKAGLDEFPFQAIVKKYNTRKTWSLCGGSIVTDRHILTAAHCVTQETKYGPEAVTVDYLKIYVGSLCLNDPQVKLNAARIFIHKCYEPNLPALNDVAVLKTKEKIEFSRNVFFVKIPTVRDRHLLLRGQRRGVKCTVQGWGKTQGRGRESNHLLYTTLRLITINRCKRLLDYRLNGDVHVCTHLPGKNVCSGDSGGGLVCNLTGIKKVYGVVSFGETSCTDYPAVYTRVDTYYKFIEDSINCGKGWGPGRLVFWTLCLGAARLW